MLIKSRNEFRLLFVVAAIALSGCATSRSTISISAPETSTSASGPAVKITEVVDHRSFSLDPRDPSQPSLGNSAEIEDQKITARAVGRKRNTFGAALGDILLPEGQTVTELVRNSAASALTQAGYRVVSSDSPDYGRAFPVKLDIQQFWAWIQPGFFALTLSFNSAVVVSSDNVVSGGRQIANGNSSMSAQTGMESNWQEIIQSGVSNLSADMKAKMIPASQVK